MRISRAQLRRDIFTYCYIIALGFLLALAYLLFVVRNNYAPAGLNGIAVMIQYKLNFSVAYMSLLINVPLCVFAFFCLDRRFAVRTLVFSLSYSLFYLWLSTQDLARFQYDAGGVDTVFPAMLAGIVSGFCYGSLFRLQASTGGTDVISKYVCQRNPTLNFFWVTFVINAAVAAVSFFVYATPDASGVMQYDYRPVCLCLLYCFVSNFLGNFIIKGSKTAYKFLIVTTHADELEREIFATLRHSATRLQGHGSFSGDEKQVLLCVVNRHQLVDFEQILKKYDNTFASVETVNETLGNFKKIK